MWCIWIHGIEHVRICAGKPENKKLKQQDEMWHA